MDLDGLRDLKDLMFFIKEVNASGAFACSLIHGKDDVCVYHVLSIT
jgi:hypothetical protein